MTAIKRFFFSLAAKPWARRMLRFVPYLPPSWVFAALPYAFRPDRGGPATGLMEINVTGKGGGTWSLDVTAEGVTVKEGPCECLPAARLKMDPRTWTALAAGRIAGTEAFSRGRIEVEGDLTLTLKLDAAFS